MQAYGMNAMRSKGHKYAEDDVSTKGWYLKGSTGRAKARNKHKRIYKKMQRAYNKTLTKGESEEEQF